MKILLVHNFYQQPGGEDQVFRAEAGILRNAGHTVVELTETNDRVKEMSALALARATIWNSDAYQRVYETATRERPAVVHFHNTFPLLSPAVYYAARRAGAAVVQTLHNYRFLCPAATLFRDGRPCEDCVGHLPWPGVLHACYRGSRTASAGIAAMLGFHRLRQTFSRQVDAFIVLNEFARQKFLRGGLPPEKLFLKPNFVDPDPSFGDGGETFLFAGRLSPEKGIEILLAAWRESPDLPLLKIAGDGPLRAAVLDQIGSIKNAEYLGRIPHAEVLAAMKSSKALIQPSTWYEMFPVNVVEAFACGLPVIASDAGALPEIVSNRTNGLLFQSGNSKDLGRKVRLLASDSGLCCTLRKHARQAFERYYQGDLNVRLLVQIYENAIQSSNSRR
ncbi:glycosyltransferase family 4 protein [Nevskia soli]|jgi:glycosyltransferase involved in cell wall biosynthesis|uniref:glycosyltransferase family 4 protein n=1 Tax=Nevskia soli TaxID=418856 RepID=UPI0015D81F60|nr:glycosyltransferase family 4 protein [Nevskia soli]